MLSTNRANSINVIMLFYRNLNICCIFTTKASLVCVPAVFCAGCSLFVMLNLIVSKFGYLSCFKAVAIFAASALLSLFFAGGSNCFCPLVVRVTVFAGIIVIRIIIALILIIRGRIILYLRLVLLARCKAKYAQSERQKYKQ